MMFNRLLVAFAQRFLPRTHRRFLLLRESRALLTVLYEKADAAIEAKDYDRFYRLYRIQDRAAVRLMRRLRSYHQ